jgi:anti-anti-sigma factor
MLLIILGSCIIGLMLTFRHGLVLALLTIGLISYTVLIVCTLSALFLLRRGRFRPSVGLAVSGITLAIGLALVASGLQGSPGIFMAFTVPLTMAGLLVGRKGLLLTGGAVIGLVVLVALLQSFLPQAVGFRPSLDTSGTELIPMFILIIAVLGLFLDRFGSSLRDALITAQGREHDLELLRASLESTVAERTASLQQALQAGEQREARLSQILEELHSSQETVRELSAPVLPVLPGVLVAPLIGTLEHARAQVLTNNVLRSVEQTHARYVILDITGVPLVDTQVAHVLLQTAGAVRLLGAQVLIVGIRPEVAQTVVALGVDIGAMTAYPDLQGAIAALLAQTSQLSRSQN